MTDQELMDELQRAVLEPPDSGASWPSGLWTRDEILGYITQRQDRFLKRTLVAVSWLDAAIVAQQPQQDLPDGWLATRNAFLTTDDGGTRPLAPLSRREADLLQPGWGTTFGTPVGYISEEFATRQLALVPAPLTDGVLHLFAALVGTPVDGSGTFLSVPDECLPYLWYGTLADMLGKQGRAYDGPKAAYCEERFEEGVQLSQALLKAVVIS